MDTKGSPERVGDRTFFFRIWFTELGGRGLERLTRSEATNRDLPLVPEFTWPKEATVAVNVTVFRADGRLYAGAVEVRTSPEPIDVPALGLTIPAPPVDAMPVDTGLWRMVPLGTLCKEAVRDLLVETAPYEATAELPDAYDSPREFGEAYETLGKELSRDSRGRRSPGRPSALSPSLMEFVAAAHKSAGPRQGQPAVRLALQYAADRASGDHPDGPPLPGMGFRGAGPGGVVTVDQAKATITRLREAGLIPPARRKSSE